MNKDQINEFNNLIAKFEKDDKFKKYANKRLRITEGVNAIPRRGTTLLIPQDNNSDLGYFFIDSFKGHDFYSYDKESTSTYFILDGTGIFEIDGVESPVSTGDIITVPNKHIFYYSGKMKMIERMTPNFKEDNVVVVEEVFYPEEKKL